MAKVKAPLFSLKASGKLGNALVYMTWKGIEDVRKYVIPTNPRSPKQVEQRGYFRDANNEWDSPDYTAGDRSAWNLEALVAPGAQSGWNRFVRFFVAVRRAAKTWQRLRNGTASAPAAGTVRFSIFTTDHTVAPNLTYGLTRTNLPFTVAMTRVGTTDEYRHDVTGLTAGQRVTGYMKQAPTGKEGRTGYYEATAT